MSRIIVLQACRHGIGCSHLVANLAVTLMHRGYRVGIVDMDPRFGGIRTLFQLDQLADRNLEAYWWLTSDLQDKSELIANLQRYDATLNTYAPGIYLPPLGGHFTIEGPQLKALQGYYGSDKAHDVLHALGNDLKLDFLLIDNQPEINDDNLMGLSLADVTLLLMQLDTYDLQRSAVLLEVVKQFETDRIWLTPTLVLPTVEFDVVKQKLETAYKQPVIGVLYLSEEMVRLASRGIFCLHFPQHTLTQTFEAIAQQLEQDTGMVPSSASA